MPRRETVELNTHVLAERVAALDMKQWVIATRLGVARRSLSRWLSGEVKKISRGNLDKLAALLGCAPEDICAEDSSPPFATRADQSQAARSIVSDTSEALFNYSENYELYENLIKATLHPDLTHRQLTVLYGNLQRAASKQRKYAEAEKYGQIALEYAIKAGDKGHEVATYMNLALLEAERGDLEQARLALVAARHRALDLGHPRHTDSIDLNLSEVALLQNDLALALKTVNICIERLSRYKDLAIRAAALLQAGTIHLALGNFQQADEYLLASAAVPANPPLMRLGAEARLQLALSACRQGDIARGLPLAREAAEILQRYSYFEFSYQVELAQVLRLAGQLDEAEQVAKQGLAAAYTRAYEVPFLTRELARIAAAKGDMPLSNQLRRKAVKGFRAGGMPLQATEL